MPEFVRTAFRKTPLYTIYRNYLSEQELQTWITSGRLGAPPHVIKRSVIRNYGHRFKIKSFVETGTFLGDMVHSVKDDFETIYSIELGSELFANAQKRFSKLDHITICHGDSGEVLADLMSKIHEASLFWLDGHYSAGITAKGTLNTPIMRELKSIFTHELAHEHVVLIDDARCFTGADDYPTTEELKETASSYGFNHFEIEDDIIRVFAKLAKR